MAELGQLETIINYICVAVFLLICMGIGVYHGCKGSRNQTPDEYLLGGRKLRLFPVALSLFVTFQSAISLMGVPAEMYTYGSLMLYMYAGLCISLIIASVTIVPLIYPLGITSAYEYLELRFKSRSVRLLAVLVSMLQTTVYMGITLYAPALALQIVADIPLWSSIIITGAVGIIYTAIGGIKSVVWTDTFQCFIIFGGTIAILIKGFLDIGSLERFGRILEDGKRIQYYDINVDPRTRHTIWSLVIGGIFTWLSSWCNQSSIQRISSLRSELSTRWAFVVSIPFSIAYGGLMGTLGLVLYVYYNLRHCDPLLAGYVTNSNQLMPYFVFDVMKGYPGLPGIYISALFSGSLSTVSSGINSLSANTVEDLLKSRLKNVSQFQVTIVAKITVVVFGCFAIGIAYVAQSVSGPVTQIALATFGACGGPVTGLFFLGALFPFANWIGALVGGVISIVFNLWISVGGVLYGRKAPKLEPNAIDGCEILNSTLTTPTTTMSWINATVTTPVGQTSTYNDIVLYDLSYMWYGLTGFFLTLVIGIIVSCFTGKDKKYETEAKYLFPFCQRFVKNQDENKEFASKVYLPELINAKKLNGDENIKISHQNTLFQDDDQLQNNKRY